MGTGPIKQDGPIGLTGERPRPGDALPPHPLPRRQPPRGIAPNRILFGGPVAGVVVAPDDKLECLVTDGPPLAAERVPSCSGRLTQACRERFAPQVGPPMLLGASPSVETSRRFTVSSPPQANVLPSGLNATD